MQQAQESNAILALHNENQHLKDKITELNSKIALIEQQRINTALPSYIILLQNNQPGLLLQNQTTLTPTVQMQVTNHSSPQQSSIISAHNHPTINNHRPQCIQNRFAPKIHIQKNSSIQMVNYFDASIATKYRFRAELRTELDRINKKIEKRGLTFENIKIRKCFDSKKKQQLEIKVVPNAKIMDPNMIFLNKDEGKLSDRAYKMFRQSTPGWPSLYRARQFRLNMEKIFPITKTPHGVYNSPKQKIEKMVNIHLNQLKMTSNNIQIKLSADGANIGKKGNLLNITFSLLQHYRNSEFIDGNFTLGIFDIIKEDYQSVKCCFQELFSELSSIKNILIGQVLFKVDFFFAADEKMLALLMGVNAANSKQPCIYCKCTVRHFYDTTKLWSITDPHFGARSFHDATKSVGKDGQINSPLVNFVPFSQFVFDLLHANLRISEHIFDKVFSELVILDWRDKTKKRQDAFTKFLVENVRIFNPIYEKNKQMCLKSFNRDENLNILSNMPLKSLFPDLKKVEKIELLWRNFFDINVNLIQNKWSSEEIRIKTKDWLDLSVDIHGREFPTLYMHMLSAHLYQFQDAHDHVYRFNCSQLEKKNHLNKSNVFRSTNLHTNLTEKDDFLIQLINKNNRTEYFKKFDKNQVQKIKFKNMRNYKRKRKFSHNFRIHKF